MHLRGPLYVYFDVIQFETINYLAIELFRDCINFNWKLKLQLDLIKMSKHYINLI